MDKNAAVIHIQFVKIGLEVVFNKNWSKNTPSNWIRRKLNFYQDSRRDLAIK